MRILFVEDNKTFANSVKQSLETDQNIIFDHVISSNAAIKALQENFYDLILLDLSIPTEDDNLDIASEHGQTVFYKSRELAPGTPIYILTGSDPDSFSLGLVKHGEKIDLWGTGSATQTIDYETKENADILIGNIKNISQQISLTEAVTIETRGKSIGLSPEFKRALKVFARLHHGSSCHIQALNGGLSDALVLRVRLTDEHGHIRALSVAKLGPADKISDESNAYNQHVKLLSIGAYPPLMYQISMGLKGSAGIFYSLAEGFDHTFFETVQQSPELSVTTIQKTRENLGRWTEAKNLQTIPVREIRRRILSDQKVKALQQKFDLSNVINIEDIEIRDYSTCIHGDLHGGNILAMKNGEAILIDFGNVGQGFACLDPVALELSMLFHPDGHKCGLSKGLIDAIDQWPNLDRYLKGNPLEPSIKACRDWAYDVAGGDKAVLAAGYAFALRQLGYDTVDSGITLNLLKSICEHFRGTTL